MKSRALLRCISRNRASLRRGALLLCSAVLAIANVATAQIPSGTHRSIEYLEHRSRLIQSDFPEQSAQWAETATRFKADVKRGVDPYPLQKGKIVNRGYRSQISHWPQGYALYLPPNYDPKKSWPLMLVLHGGSANGNLFLGVVLGNNMNWKNYRQYWWDQFEPKWSPDWIVVAPDGFGQVMWRWMGEQDVLDVLSDVQRHYNVDPNRVVLAGLSNGGVGAYAVGTRHAHRFSIVQAMAGAPSWIQYGGGRPRGPELATMRAWSGLHLAPNVENTDFRYYHGRTDGGPMKPKFVEEWEQHLKQLDLQASGTWYDAGHDILYRVQRHGRTFEALASVERTPRSRVRVSTGDYRANRQHWIEVTRIRDYPQLAEVTGELSTESVGGTPAVRAKLNAKGADALALDVRAIVNATAPASTLLIEVDGHQLGPMDMSAAGDRVHLRRVGSGSSAEWRVGFPSETGKRPGLSGPLTDAYYGPMLHVYGTKDESNTDALKAAAERGAKGWPLWLWNFRQHVKADHEVTTADIESNHLVLYTTGDDNGIYSRVANQLPIRVRKGRITAAQNGETVEYQDPADGVRFIAPNPLNTRRYVVVQGGNSVDAVRAGHNLPDFLPDYVIYNANELKSRPRLYIGRRRIHTQGFFAQDWSLPTRGADPTTGAPFVESSLPVAPAPDEPNPPSSFLAPWSDQAGKAARRIAKRAATFENFRAKTPGATWRTDTRSVWKVQRRAKCESRLRSLSIPFQPLLNHKTPLPSPVEITGPVNGVWFRMLHDDRPLTISCELAKRLPKLASILKSHGYTGVDVMSAYRDKPFTSFHTMGLALDLARFWDGERWHSVLEDFVQTPNKETCEARHPRGTPAESLRSLACALAASGLFSTVLTPNYNAGHRDHFHLDSRPDDPRVFLR